MIDWQFSSCFKTVKMSSKRKLQSKTLLDKCNALRDIERGMTNKDVSMKYNVPIYVPTSILKSVARGGFRLK